VTLTNLEPETTISENLFQEDNKRVSDLSKSIDNLNSRFGAKTVFFGATGIK
jgi:hypothetical protein